MTIWKFTLSPANTQNVSMPRGASILSAQVQHEQLCIWAIVDPDEPRENRTIVIVGTGHLVSEVTRLHYIGTAQMSGGSLICFNNSETRTELGTVDDLPWMQAARNILAALSAVERSAKP